MDNPFGYKKSKNFYTPGQSAPFKLSRSKIDLFTDCKRCFFLDSRFGIGRPQGAPFTLNIAVDALLKKEFDIHRANNSKHPLMEKYGVDAVPFAHDNMNEWRENFVGVQALYKPANFLIFGAVDDVWQNSDGELMVVDYKATAKEGVVDKLEGTKWHDQYKRQMEIYQWLLKENGHKVSNTGYFVYVNGKKDNESFDAKLEFDVRLIEYTGRQNWIPKVLDDIKVLLDSDEIPEASESCDYCTYRTYAGEAMRDHLKSNGKKLFK